MNNLSSSQFLAPGADETTFRAKSSWYVAVPFLIGAVVLGWLAFEIGTGPGWGDWLGLDSSFVPLAAWGLGGLALLVAAGAAWSWYAELRWIVVGKDGLRWFRGGRTHARSWADFIEVQRGTQQYVVDGQVKHTIAFAEIRFQSGPSLFVNPGTVHDYDMLIPAIENAQEGWASGARAAR